MDDHEVRVRARTPATAIKSETGTHGARNRAPSGGHEAGSAKSANADAARRPAQRAHIISVAA
jgi:hypothetical protein